MKLKIKIMKALVFLCIVGFVFSCQKSNILEDNQQIITDVSKLSTMNNEMAWDIFIEEAKANPKKNVLISPWSIQTALSMALNGAGTMTLDEMRKLMYCDGCDPNLINEQQQKLALLLSNRSGHPSVTISNSYFYDKSRINLNQSFQKKLESYYDCSFRPESFGNEVQSLENINNRVKSSTHGKIDKVLNKITQDDAAFLINALHFKADWARGFDPKMMSKNDFTKADGSKITSDFVNGDVNLPFAFQGDFMIADIPFRDSTYSLSLITTTSLSAPKSLTKEVYKSLLSSLRPGRIMLTFPKMKLSYENNLIPSLQKLGVKSAFSENSADFKAMGTASKNIFINQFLHKAVLEVDEKGAEGAAVTTIGFGVTSVPPTLLFNKPFYVVLRHIQSNTIMFISFVVDSPIQ